MFEYIGNILEEMNNRKFLFVISCCSILLGVLDFIIGAEYSFSVFYTIPIMIATWYGGKAIGLSIAVFSSLIWLAADIATGNPYSNSFVPVWNTFVRLAFFIIILKLLLITHEKLRIEESLADTDLLTGLANRRFLLEQLEREYTRVRRTLEPLTIAFIDLDNFKYVNDTNGHEEGDELLKIVSATFIDNIRKSDFVSRIGGDEFVVLFPIIKKEAVFPMLEKLQKSLLDSMKSKGWPVTFSIGAITFFDAMDSSREMLKKVDDLMYEVKKSGKNNIRYIEWPEKTSHNT